MSFVVLAGIGFTALRSGSIVWFKAVYGLTVLTLLVAVLAARYRGPFWYGFAFWGWGIFLLGLGPWWSDSHRYGMGWSLNGSLPTTWAIERVTMVLVPVPSISPNSPGSGQRMADYSETFACTQAIAHLLTTLLIATIGGILAVYLSAARAATPRRLLSHPTDSPIGEQGTHRPANAPDQ